MSCIQFADTVTLYTTTLDDYGTEALDDNADVPAAIDFNTGYLHNASQDAIDSDAVLYLPHDHSFVADNYNRLEEMLVKIPLFDTPDAMAWYKVTKVVVARDTQLCNEIDHLEVLVKKIAEPKQ